MTWVKDAITTRAHAGLPPRRRGRDESRLASADRSIV